MVRALMFGMFMTASALTNAGQVTLTNGDSLQGILKRIEGEVVIWESASLGEVRLPKAAIATLESSEPMRIQGKDVACYLGNVESQKATFTCIDGERKTYSLLSLNNIVTFESSELGNRVYAGNFRASGLKHSGTIETEFWEVLINLEHRRSEIRHSALLAYSSRYNESAPSAEGVITRTRHHRLQSTYGLDWFFAPQWFWANELSYGSDDAFNIQEQYAFNTGLGYQFWETDASALSFELGLQHILQYLSTEGVFADGEAYTSARFASDYRRRLGSGLNFYNNNEYTHSLESPEPGARDRRVIVMNTGLSFPIGFGISADVGMEWKYVNHARDLEAAASQSDLTYRFGINYAW